MNLSPLYSSVCAGGPSLLDDGEMFDLAAHLVKHPNHTFYVRVSGQSMTDCRIEDGDLLIVDSSAEPQPSDVVVVQSGSGFTVKQFNRENGRLRLVPASPNPEFKPIDPNEDARVCGVALFAIHKL